MTDPDKFWPALYRGRRDVPEPLRFWAKVDFTEGACWVWRGARTGRGYGNFALQEHGRSLPAHRWAYEFCVGPVAAGLQLDHLCRNRGCVNPDHLEPVTQKENLRRGTQRQSEKTACPRGHPYDRLVRRTGGLGWKRSCLQCDRAHARRNREARALNA